MAETPPGQRGFILGGEDGNTLGGEDGGFLGPQRDQSFRVELVAPSGRTAVIDAVLGVNIVFEHTGLSDCQIDIPAIDGLGDFRLGEFRLFFGNQLLFVGTVEEYPGPTTADSTVIQGPGPARVLTRAELSVSYSGVEAHEAIREVWREDTPFTATVFTPPETTTLSDFSASGTAMEVLQALHEQAGLRFVVQHGEVAPTVESFDPGDVTRSTAWTSVDHDFSGDASGFANHVIVRGAIPDGGSARARGTAEDTASIDEVGRQTWLIDDDTLTTDADCQARAESVLAEKVGEQSLSGTVEIVPDQIVLPGYHYSVPEAGGVELPLKSVDYSESMGEATATLGFDVPESLVDEVASLRRAVTQLQQP